jgi:hypothetical protein
MHATSPDLYEKVTLNSQYIEAHIEAGDATAMAFALGMGVNLRLNDLVGLGIAFDYLSAKPEFEDVGFSVNNGVDYVSGTSTFKMQMSMIVPSVGLVWKL